MTKYGPIAVAALMVLVGSVTASAGDVVVIANPNVKADSISAAELRRVFLLEEKSLADGTQVKPVLAKGGAAHALFLKQYVGKSDDDLRNFYRTLVFTGTGWMPKSLPSDSQIVAYVAQTKGAIGYVDSDSALQGVKVLIIEQNPSGIGRILVRRVEPDYPEDLQKRGIGGTVRLELVISPKGDVETISVIGGNPILTETAVNAVKQWVYAPSPSRTRLQVSIPFQPHP
jgi:TonB family protein